MMKVSIPSFSRGLGIHLALGTPHLILGFNYCCLCPVDQLQSDHDNNRQHIDQRRHWYASHILLTCAQKPQIRCFSLVLLAVKSEVLSLLGTNFVNYAVPCSKYILSSVYIP